jgi:hypothetical protein
MIKQKTLNMNNSIKVYMKHYEAEVTNSNLPSLYPCVGMSKKKKQVNYN